MSSYTFTVPGDPVPWGRARLGKGGRHFTPTKTRDFKTLVRLAAQAAGVRPIPGPVLVVVAAYWEWPKAMQRKRDPRGEAWLDTGPDVDNIAKGVMDALNGCGYTDDRQASLLVSGKLRAAQGQPSRTDVRIRPLGGLELSDVLDALK